MTRIESAEFSPSEGLQWVRKELAATIADARNNLEKFSEHPGNREPLKQVAEQLHVAHGALRMVEVYGAALLVEEMVTVTTSLFNGESNAVEDSLDALSRAIVQLPSYLDRIAGGGHDIPLLLLPLLNDLRAVHGSPLLSESSLFVLNVDQGAATPARTVPSEHFDYRELAKKIRPHYQRSLLGWLKGENITNNLRILAKAVKRLEDGAASTPVYQFWWVLGGVVEAIHDAGLRPGASVKRLLGQADRELKMLAREGEDFFARQPPKSLLNNLLYYVARADSKGARVAAIKASFSLASVVQPDNDGHADDHTVLQAPSVDLMKTVGAAIKQDVGRVKDAIDIFVRTGSTDYEQLTVQRESLRKLSDTLGVLGLDELRQQIAGESRRLHTYIQETKTDDDDLLQIAATLIDVEAAIEEQLLGIIIPSQEQAGNAPRSTREIAAVADVKQVTSAVLRECVVNLTRIKEAFSQFIDKPDGGGGVLDTIPGLLRGIAAGLNMLDKSRAAELLVQIELHINSLASQHDLDMHSHELDRLADAIVSVEYYMETIRAGRSEPVYMLENAEICLHSIKKQLAPGPVSAPMAAQEAMTDEALIEATGVREAAKPTAAAPEFAGRLPPLDRPLVMMEGRRTDPELLELFIEEAKDEVASLRRSLPRWLQDNEDRDVLLTMRRSFHTLKGSGRMVGAALIGEYAWGIENLINKLVSRRLTADDEIVELVTISIDSLPQLIEQLEVGTPPDAALTDLTDRIWRCAETPPAESEPVDEFAVQPETPEQPILHEADAAREAAVESPMPEATGDESAALVTDVAPVSAPDAAPPVLISVDNDVPGIVLEMQPAEPDYSGEDDNYAPAPAIALDPALHEIFLKESLERLAVINGFLEDFATEGVPVAVSEILHRAWHTLSGSANTADVAPAAAIATPLNNHLRGLLAEGQPLNAQAIGILQHASAMFEDIVRGINTQSELPDTRELLNEIETLPTLGTAALQAVMALDGSGEITLPEGVGVGYDPEIAAIFVEEATEILDASEQALAAWFQDPAKDSPKMLELLRHLHTLKGGARMAGVGAIGDMSHETESLVEHIRDGEQLLDEAARRVLQLSFDRMHSMTEQLHNGQPVTDAKDVLERIAALDTDVGDESSVANALPVIDELLADKSVSDELVSGALVTDGPVADELVSGTLGADGSVADERVPDALVDDESVADDLVSEELGAEALVADELIASELPDGGLVEDGPILAEPPSSLPHGAADVAVVNNEAGAVSAASRAKEPAPPPAKPAMAAAAGSDTDDNKPLDKVHDKARIDARLLDEMLNNAGEVSIFHSRLEEQVGSISFNLTELHETVARLREQLRNLEIETEAQILHRYQDDTRRSEEFDPLELDRYSGLQQLSRALAESVSDLVSLQGLMIDITRESESLLVQQARVTGELQDALISARMLPFEHYVPRFERILRQVAGEQNKRVALTVAGGSGELDRQVLQRMLPPFEHMLRNAVIHGIEQPAARQSMGKPEQGEIRIELRREGAEMVIHMNDDGQGLDPVRLREKAIQQGLLEPTRDLSDEETYAFILTPGFSMASELTQSAGRGVGMDVVANEVKMLGGSLKLESSPGQGTTIIIRLPLTLAISQALLVRCGDERFALPLPAVESIVRVPRDELSLALRESDHWYEHNGNKYAVCHLGPFLGGPEVHAEHLRDPSVPVILIRAGEHSSALLVDELLGSREVVVKSAGPMVAGITGITGATILGDGSIVVILDVAALVRNRTDKLDTKDLMMAVTSEDLRPTVLVVDDSITVRRVTQRLLERNSMRVLLAKDGVDAVAIMQDQVPDLVLLDIEMPRMDGYEVASHIRNTDALQHVPITMITSRVGDKHRARAFELGVDKYLGKPYQENQLLDVIQPLLARSVKQRI